MDAKDINWKDLLARIRKAALHEGADRVEWHVESDTVRGMDESGPPKRPEDEG